MLRRNKSDKNEKQNKLLPLPLRNSLILGGSLGVASGLGANKAYGDNDSRIMRSESSKVFNTLLERKPYTPNNTLSFLTNPLNPKQGAKELEGKLDGAILRNAKHINSDDAIPLLKYANLTQEDYINSIRGKTGRNAALIAGLGTGLLTSGAIYRLYKRKDIRRKQRSDKGRKRLSRR